MPPREARPPWQGLPGFHKLDCGCGGLVCQKSTTAALWPVTVLCSRGPLKLLNGTKLILDNQANKFESFRSFRGPLFHKPVTGQILFIVTWYKTPRLQSWKSEVKTTWISLIDWPLRTSNTYLEILINYSQNTLEKLSHKLFTPILCDCRVFLHEQTWGLEWPHLNSWA